MFVLPLDKRHFFKAPFGILYTDIKDILTLIVGKTVYTVGDIVTDNIVRQGITPALAIIDGHSMRSPINRPPPVFSKRLYARNPPGTLTRDLLETLNAAVKEPEVLIIVDGEEDLAVIPLVIAAPTGVVILYGQPGKGVVLCEVTEGAKEKAAEMLSHFTVIGTKEE
jgi:uncharacterized protein (UPF0218 family)